MAKKYTKRTIVKSTDWNVGQPLAFPQTNTAVKQLAQEALNEAARGPFSSKRSKRKKK